MFLGSSNSYAGGGVGTWVARSRFSAKRLAVARPARKVNSMGRGSRHLADLEASAMIRGGRLQRLLQLEHLLLQLEHLWYAGEDRNFEAFSESGFPDDHVWSACRLKFFSMDCSKSAIFVDFRCATNATLLMSASCRLFLVKFWDPQRLLHLESFQKTKIHPCHSENFLSESILPQCTWWGELWNSVPNLEIGFKIMKCRKSPRAASSSFLWVVTSTLYNSCFPFFCHAPTWKIRLVFFWFV